VSGYVNGVLRDPRLRNLQLPELSLLCGSISLGLKFSLQLPPLNQIIPHLFGIVNSMLPLLDAFRTIDWREIREEIRELTPLVAGLG